MITYENIEITPQMATEMLECNTNNRPLSPAFVKSYANTMKRGEWRNNGEDIIFFSNGVLGNGAHRLHAIVQSGCTVLMGVKHGVDPLCFPTYDNGRARTAGQIIAMQGVKNAGNLAAIAKYFDSFKSQKMSNVQYCGSGTLSHVTSAGTGLTNQQVLNIFEDYRSPIIFAYEQTSFVKKRIVTRTFIAALYVFLEYECGYEFNVIDKFFRGVISNESSPNPYINGLRNELLDANSGNYKMKSSYIVNIIAKTWNDCMSQAEIQPVRSGKHKGERIYKPSWNSKDGQIFYLHADTFDGRQLLLDLQETDC